jgi:drug/metabolite transporter (DMT)-like permease
MSKQTRTVIAYLALCLAWGSTYLAIRIGVGHLPPALFAAVRLVAAGCLLLALARMGGQRLPTRWADWRTNAIAGLLLLAVAHGLVVWSEQFVSSGTAAVFIVTVSLWFPVFEALWPGGAGRPTLAQVLGLVVGFLGTVLLVGADLDGVRRVDWRGPVGLTVAAISWAFGSVYMQRRPTASGPYVNASLQMLSGGLILLAVGTVTGEWGRFALTWPGTLALVYLTVVGSLIGFSSFIYVLHNVRATIAGTYAYVNTVIAILLGWLVLSEPLSARSALAMSIVIGAVIWVRLAARSTTPVARRRPSRPVPAPATGDA